MIRTLSLLPSATEIVYELGLQEWLVGVTHECDYPAAALAMPRVTSARINPSFPSEEIDRLVRKQLDESGSLYALDMELVRELQPQLVLTQQLCTVCAVGYGTVREAMRSLPEPPEVVNLEPRNLHEVLESIIAVGRMLGAGDATIAAAAAERVAELRARLARIPALDTSPRVLFLEWLIPPFSAGHWMGELVAAAGATPVLANIGEHSRGLAWEAIRAAEFDAAVISCCGFDVERTLRDVALCAELRELRAERPGLRVIVMDGNHFFSRPGPRLVESAELLNRALAGVRADEAGATIALPYAEL